METAKLFQNGKSQAVRLPRKFRFRGDRVLIKRLGDAVMLYPYEDPWRAWLENFRRFSADFMETRDQPETQEREFPFT